MPLQKLACDELHRSVASGADGAGDTSLLVCGTLRFRSSRRYRFFCSTWPMSSVWTGVAAGAGVAGVKLVT